MNSYRLEGFKQAVPHWLAINLFIYCRDNKVHTVSGVFNGSYWRRGPDAMLQRRWIELVTPDGKRAESQTPTPNSNTYIRVTARGRRVRDALRTEYPSEFSGR